MRGLLAALLLALAAAPAVARSEAPVEAVVERSGQGFVARFTFPLDAPAWAFWRSAAAVADGKPWRPRSWTVLTPGVRLERRGRFDALVGIGGRPVPRRVAVRIVPFTGELAADYVSALLLGGRGVALFDGHFATFSVADAAALERFGIEPPDHEIGDPGTRVRFGGGGRRFRLAGDVAGYRAGMSSGTYGLYDVPRATVAGGIATVIDSETPVWLADHIARFTPRALGVLQGRLGPSGISEPTVLAAWEGATRNGASLNGGTLKGLILMRLEGKAALRPNTDLRDMTRWFIAHEASHFWLGQAVSYATSKDSWIMEGGADLLAARTVQQLDPAYRPTVFLNQAIRDCAKAAGKPVALAPERGEHRTTYACGTVFALVAEKASGGDFYAFVRRLIAANRAKTMVASGDWLRELGSPVQAAAIDGLLEKGASDPKLAIAGLLRGAGIAFTIAADGLPTL